MRIQGNISTVPGRSWFNTQFSREFEKVVEMRETEKERVEEGRETEKEKAERRKFLEKK